MNFDLSEEQQLLADSLKRYLANEYTMDARSKIVDSPAGWSERGGPTARPGPGWSVQGWPRSAATPGAPRPFSPRRPQGSRTPTCGCTPPRPAAAWAD